MNKTNIQKLNKTPKILFVNKHLINSTDNTNDSDSNNYIFNKIFINSPNNPLVNKEYLNKSKKDLLLAEKDTTNLSKNNKNKKERKNIINKSSNNDNSEKFLMEAKLSPSFRTIRNNCHSHGLKNYPKEKLKQKTKMKNNINNNTNKKEKESNISDGRLFETFPLESNNVQMDEKISAISKIESFLLKRNQSKKRLINMKWTYLINLLSNYLKISKLKNIQKEFKRIQYFEKKKNYIKICLKIMKMYLMMT